jgi:hypothetical protein
LVVDTGVFELDLLAGCQIEEFDDEGLTAVDGVSEHTDAVF